MESFPAFFPLAGARVVVAGEGEMAQAKARLFEGSPAVVERVSGAAAIDSASYAGARLAFVAGGDAAFRRAAAAAARAAHVPVNVVDEPELCDFFTPALIDRGAVVVAVGTAGASPVLAAALRDILETQTPAGVGALAALLRGRRSALRNALPDIGERGAFLRAWLASGAGQAGLAGDVDLAARDLEAALAARASSS
jgi:precorrin-2 dehydrogenase/sirohydrochlorin ferrochelatase